MDAIEKIIEQINEKAVEEREIYREEALQTIQATTDQQKAAIETEHEKQLDKQLQGVKNKYKQLRSRQQVEVRQETLIEKQHYLDKLFEEAYEIMSNWSKNEMQQFAKSCLQALPINGEVMLLTGEKNQLVLSSDWLEEISNELSYTLHLGEAIQNEGFIVDDQGIQYNFLYRDLLNELRSQAGSEITRELFE